MKRLYQLLFTWVLFCLLLSVGLWTGILMNPNKFESLEIKSATVAATGQGWLITMNVRNRGTMESVINYVDVNGTTVKREDGLTNCDGLVISVQSEAEVWVKISNPPYERGTAAIVGIITTKGNHYTEVAILPMFGNLTHEIGS